MSFLTVEGSYFLLFYVTRTNTEKKKMLLASIKGALSRYFSIASNN